MNSRPNPFWFLCLSIVIVFLITLYGLLTQAAWLSMLILGRFPLGNLAIAFSLTGLSLISLHLATANTLLRYMAWSSFWLTLFWYPIGVVWSGNLVLHFVNSGEMWKPYSYSVSLYCIFVTIACLTGKILIGEQACQNE
ncbi:hypothetical protein DRW07_13620 [Alteromonas sediminis]|uniref:Uncharacterized protein n=1 Tax=Alteromonas sediminis TaxID=2259342 RepID=A0A3N5YAL5_9ALTE|nr:hypothetical protein [Alteromonas sediminis]RPJ65845.1 hypothetical protein DRW07_13620 [Alteromonas sediminis]